MWPQEIYFYYFKTNTFQHTGLIIVNRIKCKMWIAYLKMLWHRGFPAQLKASWQKCQPVPSRTHNWLLCRFDRSVFFGELDCPTVETKSNRSKNRKRLNNHRWYWTFLWIKSKCSQIDSNFTWIHNYLDHCVSLFRLRFFFFLTIALEFNRTLDFLALNIAVNFIWLSGFVMANVLIIYFENVLEKYYRI